MQVVPFHRLYATNFEDEFELPITTHFDTRKGIYLAMPSGDHNIELPCRFINRSSKASNVTFTTIELQQKNARVTEALNEVLLMSEDTIENLLCAIAPHLGHLCMISEGLALLDMVGTLTGIMQCLILSVDFLGNILCF